MVLRYAQLHCDWNKLSSFNFIKKKLQRHKIISCGSQVGLFYLATEVSVNCLKPVTHTILDECEVYPSACSQVSFSNEKTN